MSSFFFLFGNYCCLDSPHPPLIRKTTLTKGVRGVEPGARDPFPPPMVPEVAGRRPHSGHLPGARPLPSSHPPQRDLHAALEAAQPHGSSGCGTGQRERSPAEFSEHSSSFGLWHCGYRRLVFKLQVLLVLKISRPSSIICSNNKKKEYENVKTQLKGVFAEDL